MLDLAVLGVETSPRVVLTTDYDARASVPSLEDQLSQWPYEVRPNIELEPHKTLATIWFGLNDLAAMRREGYEDKLEHEDALEPETEIFRRLEVIANGMDTLVLTEVHSFLIPNVSLDLIDGAALILQCNGLLERRTTAWMHDIPEIKVYLFDAFDLYNQFLAFPEKFGFTNTKDYCFSTRLEEPGLDCAKTAGSPTYLRMDWIHWTTKAHLALAWAISEFITEQQTMPKDTKVETAPQSGMSLFILLHYKSVFCAQLLSTMSMAAVLLFVIIRQRTVGDGATKYSPLDFAEVQSSLHTKDMELNSCTP